VLKQTERYFAIPDSRSSELATPFRRDEHLREIAEKVRQLAPQTQLPEAREELFDLADRLDRIARGGKTGG
jgi:hypothetical protein